MKNTKNNAKNYIKNKLVNDIEAEKNNFKLEMDNFKFNKI